MSILKTFQVPLDYATKVCNMFASLGSLGTTVFFSSGDDGYVSNFMYCTSHSNLSSVGAGNCLTNDGTKRTIFQPNFPARCVDKYFKILKLIENSCPFVTTVGATTGINPEKAISFSGGGFSNYFAAPSYQSSQVKSFISALGTKNAGLFK